MGSLALFDMWSPFHKVGRSFYRLGWIWGWIAIWMVLLGFVIFYVNLFIYVHDADVLQSREVPDALEYAPVVVGVFLFFLLIILGSEPRLPSVDLWLLGYRRYLSRLFAWLPGLFVLFYLAIGGNPPTEPTSPEGLTGVLASYLVPGFVLSTVSNVYQLAYERIYPRVRDSYWEIKDELRAQLKRLAPEILREPIEGRLADSSSDDDPQTSTLRSLYQEAILHTEHQALDFAELYLEMFRFTKARRLLREHAAPLAEHSTLRTGEACMRPGSYRSNCDCEERVELAVGENAPDCLSCGHPTSWIAIRHR